MNIPRTELIYFVHSTLGVSLDEAENMTYAELYYMYKSFLNK